VNPSTKILCLAGKSDRVREWSRLPADVELVTVESPLKAIEMLRSNHFDGFLIADSQIDSTIDRERPLQNHFILDKIPDGVVLLDSENKVVWANQPMTNWFHPTGMVGMNFYDALGKPQILGPTANPLSAALAQRKSSWTTVKVGDNRYFKITATPVPDASGRVEHLIVSVNDVTQTTLERQKLEALHEAGVALADLTPEEIHEMDVEQRIDLLKANVLHYTQHILNFNVIEIRLLDHETGQLIPLLSVGIDSEISKKPLYAKAHGNGVTGFVVATGKSYLCEDTTNDPLYLDGLIGAKSSLTVPLIYHDQVIGSFNVESPEIGAFSESDLQFLEIFSRDIAIALNTLELLVAQRAETAIKSVEAIHGAVALPIDAILNDAVHVIERYIGHDPEVVRRLRSILKNARDIKQVIQKVGEKMAPTTAVPGAHKDTSRPKLKNRRVLVIDADPEVRNSAHILLERYGCIVETATEGNEALLMVRNSGPEHAYSAIIADIRLPDMDGYQLLLKLKEMIEKPPLVLMTGFGYDPGHTIVKSRREGLAPNAVLYKPFRLDQLLETVENMLVGENAVVKAK
jgi:CheY-like chemotaxis protein/GAF domain-containing protein/PAS domain-containing protein